MGKSASIIHFFAEVHIRYQELQNLTNHQPIRSHIIKFLSTNINFNMNFLTNQGTGLFVLMAKECKTGKHFTNSL